MEVLLFGGTSEGRLLAEWLRDLHIPVTVCVATEYGSLLLPQGVTAHTGRLDQAGMEREIDKRPYTWVIDATHPYAVEVTKQLQAAAASKKLPYLRLLRTSDGEDLCHKADSLARAAEMLQHMRGNILLTTGSKELDPFAAPGLVERCFPRVLPTLEALERCLTLGFPPSHILCMQGPFSQMLNEALIRQYDIKILVTKDSGGFGGFQNKVQAARAADCAVMMVERPIQETGLTLEEIQGQIMDSLRLKIPFSGRDTGSVLMKKEEQNRI
ncbi:MAG: precorrin-6A reductase [Oscillospiraceae bacterium]|nr:precorrin-6A reductase [Oscillospiraceae bacterium]